MAWGGGGTLKRIPKTRSRLTATTHHTHPEPPPNPHYAPPPKKTHNTTPPQTPTTYHPPARQSPLCTSSCLYPSPAPQRLIVWESTRRYGNLADIYGNNSSKIQLAQEQVKIKLYGAGGSGEVTDKPFVTLFR